MHARSSSSADDRFGCWQSAIGRYFGDVPFDVYTVANTSQERGEAPIVRVDREPARGAIAGIAEGMGHPRRRGDEAAWWNSDRLALAPDLERQLALEDVERIGVLAVDMRACHPLTGRAPRLSEGDVLAGDEDAELGLLAAVDRLRIADREDYMRRLDIGAHDYDTGVSPCRRMTSPSAAKSGGPPAVALTMAAVSRKYSGPRTPGVTIAKALASASFALSNW